MTWINLREIKFATIFLILDCHPSSNFFHICWLFFPQKLAMRAQWSPFFKFIGPLLKTGSPIREVPPPPQYLLLLCVLWRPRTTAESVQENTFHSVGSLWVIYFSVCSQYSFIRVICSFNFCPIVTLTNTLPSIMRPLSNKRPSP